MLQGLETSDRYMELLAIAYIFKRRIEHGRHDSDNFCAWRSAAEVEGGHQRAPSPRQRHGRHIPHRYFASDRAIHETIIASLDAGSIGMNEIQPQMVSITRADDLGVDIRTRAGLVPTNAERRHD